jgi:hypothetical protein
LKTVAVGLSALLVASAVIFVGGGPIAERFAGGGDSEIAFRPLIWRDALTLIHASPWCGIGLGNFEALFPFYRAASVIQSRVLHPESDWLWLASEEGWLAVVLVLAMLGIWVRQSLPLESGTQSRLRGAALAGAMAAAAHGAVDVPLHRLGSALVALFVFAIARRDPLPVQNSRWAVALWRGLGTLLLAACAWRAMTPDDVARAEVYLEAGRFPEADVAATRALERAPLDWHAYFMRAQARVCSGRILEAVADFRRARLLEPQYAGVPLEEGKFWMGRRIPALALQAWQEALNRVASPEVGEVFGTILDSGPNDAGFRARVLDIVRGRPALELSWLRSAPPAEAKAHLAELSGDAETWGAERRAEFQRLAEQSIANEPPSR